MTEQPTIIWHRGDYEEAPLTGLKDRSGNSTTFGLDDILRFTAKFDYADATTLFAFESTAPSDPADNIQIGVGTDEALIKCFPTDWPSDLVVTRETRFVWDVEYLIGGVEATKETLDSGVGLILPDVTGAPTGTPAAAAPTAIQTCTPWATPADVLGQFAYDGDDELLALGMQIASDNLFELTGKRWRGICTDVIRPTAQWRSYNGPPRWWQGTVRGAWGYCSCHRIRETGCTRIPEIRLPGNPVDASSIEVLIDGVAFTDFALHDKRYLARTDGSGWPCCQNLLLDETEANTWQVSYSWGMRPPPGGRAAAIVYGHQLALALDPGSTGCKLPERVTTITRQGVSKVILDPLSIIKDGMTGLSVVDQWVVSTRLGAARRPATVLVPGRTRSARRIS